jgi:ATPase subunit of ABC transporter with duplicated ATPase domains
MIIVSHDKAFLSKVTERQFLAERDGNTGKIIL